MKSKEGRAQAEPLLTATDASAPRINAGTLARDWKPPKIVREHRYVDLKRQVTTLRPLRSYRDEQHAATVWFWRSMFGGSAYKARTVCAAIKDGKGSQS